VEVRLLCSLRWGFRWAVGAKPCVQINACLVLCLPIDSPLDVTGDNSPGQATRSLIRDSQAYYSGWSLPMIGKTISHYKILEKLGEGGMGVVYKAEDTELQRNVALKFLTPQSLGNEEEVARFVHEARSAAALDHPNICTVHEIGKTEDQTFIAMAYIEGQSLKDKIEVGPLKINEAVGLAIQIAEGLQKAHGKDIVHRDIKPANIMMTLEGQAKIMDFGLAKSSKHTALTQAGTTLGTVAYMSPEQARGEEVDGQADLWSLGAVLYEMVTGQKPFKGDYEPAVVYSILNQEQEPLTALRTGVPMELERIVNKCLAKDKSERYQTAGDLTADLRHLKRIIAESGAQSRMAAPSEVVGAQSNPAVPSKMRGGRSRPWLLAFAVVVIVILAVALTRHYFTPSEEEMEGPGSSETISERKMLVVLPFENLGAPEDEYFADGMTEEITSRLASLRGLGVISRTSAVHYKGAHKSIGQIGEELGVGFVLEGTVRWDRTSAGESHVRVTPQLIRVSDDTHLWSERYDQKLENIFEVQSQIAEQVIEQLDVALLSAERETLADKPTDNMEAYHAYLRGLEYDRKFDIGEERKRLEVQMFERAVELDPDFALAHAALSRAHSALIIMGMDATQERLDKAKAAADRALELQPALPEAHLALGYYYYWGLKEYDKAKAELGEAAKGLPNETEILKANAYISRRQGRWDEALEQLLRASELDPLDAYCATEIGHTYRFMRKYELAIQYYDRSIALAPDQIASYVFRVFAYWEGWGDLERARASLEAMPTRTDLLTNLVWCLQEIMERNYQAALDRINLAPFELIEVLTFVYAKPQLAGLMYLQMGETDRARQSFESARTILEEELAKRPGDARIHSSLGLVYAVLGQSEKAIEEGLLAVEMDPVSRDALSGPFRVQDLAQIYAIVGDQEAALEQIEYLLSIPCGISAPILRIAPEWDLMRDNPEFQRLLEEYSRPES
jgi:serine/threonine protein kinase/tetratricopeptide (TPR) repeat protein